MRLFTAITIPEDVKHTLYSTSLLIKKNCSGGNFSRLENYHVTLVFLGEIENSRVNDVKKIINSAATCINPFTLSCLDVGHFNKGNKKILYYNVGEDTRRLSELQLTLYKSFFNVGMCREEKSYTPHITFARQVRIEEIPKIQNNIMFKADKITLMHSTRVDGQLSYIPIFSANLRKNV